MNEKQIAERLITIERRLESNDMDDWDIGLGLVRELRKELNNDVKHENDGVDKN